MSSHAAALHGICPVVLYVQLSAAGIVSDVCPMSCICTGIGVRCIPGLVPVPVYAPSRCGCFWFSRTFVRDSDNAPESVR